MKKGFFMMGTILSMVGLIGCSNAASKETEDDKVQIKLWIEEEAYGSELVEKINEALPHINVVQEKVSTGDVAEKLTLDGPAGLGGDIIFQTQESMAKSFQSNILLPIGEQLTTYVNEQIIENSLNAIMSNNVMYGVPISVESLSLFYNKTLLENNGFELASTFEQIMEDAKIYNKPQEGKFLLRFEPGNTYTCYPFLTAAGFELFGPNGDDPSQVNLNSPEVIEGLTMLTQLQNVLSVPSDDLVWDTVHGEFVKGNVGYIIGGPWQFKEIKDGALENGFEWGVTTLPTMNGKQPQPFLGNIVASISAYTEHPNEAREVLEYISSPAGLQVMYDMTGKLPALKDLTLVNGVTDDRYIMGMSEQVKSAKTMPMVKELNYLYEASDVMVKSVWNKMATPEVAAQKAYDDFTSLIELNK